MKPLVNQAIKEAREKKIKEATISDINQYRKEERKTALALQTEEIKKIDVLTTKEEIDFTVDELKGIVDRLRSMSPLYEDFVKKNGGK